MEYLPGGTLKQKSRVRSESEYSSEEILKLFKPVLEGLAFLHSEGLVHCDISPDNLMFDAAGNLKLIDLGACRGRRFRLREEVSERIATVRRSSTRTRNRSDPGRDVYGICAVLFETLTRRENRSSVARSASESDELRPVSYYTKIDRAGRAGDPAGTESGNPAEIFQHGTSYCTDLGLHDRRTGSPFRKY